MTQGKKFLVLVGIIFCIALFYFIFFNDHSSDLQLIGIVDANQVIVGPGSWAASKNWQWMKAPRFTPGT